MERAPQRDEERPILFGVTKTPRKLHKQAAELARTMEWPHAFLKIRDLPGTERALMCEPAAQLHGELELWVLRDFLKPQARQFRLDGLIKTGVDCDRVEILGQIFQCVETSRLQPGIHNAVPVWVRPTGGAAIECSGEGHGTLWILLLFPYQYRRRQGENQEPSLTHLRMFTE